MHLQINLVLIIDRIFSINNSSPLLLATWSLFYVCMFTYIWHLIFLASIWNTGNLITFALQVRKWKHRWSNWPNQGLSSGSLGLDWYGINWKGRCVSTRGGRLPCSVRGLGKLLLMASICSVKNCNIAIHTANILIQDISRIPDRKNWEEPIPGFEEACH